MSLLQLILVLVVFGVILWAVSIAPFIQPTVKTLIYWVVCVVLVLWLLQVFGLLPNLGAVRIGR